MTQGLRLCEPAVKRPSVSRDVAFWLLFVAHLQLSSTVWQIVCWTLFKDAEKETIALVIFNFSYHIQIDILWRFTVWGSVRHIETAVIVTLLHMTYIISSMEAVLLPILSDTNTLSQLLTSHKIQIISWTQPCGLSIMMHSLCTMRVPKGPSGPT